MPDVVRVTYFINSLEQGGAERQLAELIRGLDRGRYEPSLVVCTRKDQLGFVLPVAALRSLDAPVFPTPGSVARLVRVLRELRPDVLHTVKGWENIAGRVAARRAGVRAVVGSVRCPHLPRTERWGEALTWRMAGAMVVNSVGIRDTLVRDAGMDSAAVTVVENGVDLRRFRPLSEPERAGARKTLGMDGTFTLVVPGRLSGEKNQLAIVRAVGRLARAGVLPTGFRLVLAGRDTLPVYGHAVRLAARAEGVHGRVRFAGVVDGIERLVGAADGVLLPSRYEGLPNAVVEAMACGVPAVVSQAANADALVTDGVEGLVAPTHDVDGIADALRRYLALGEGERRAMGRRGRAHAEARFAMGRMVSQTAAVYERLLGAAERMGS